MQMLQMALMRHRQTVLLTLGLLSLTSLVEVRALEEFKAKRQEVFEFTTKPVMTRNGDKHEVKFAVKAYCDATIAVEDAQGRIVRHLVSGVLGANAPEPFQKNSLEQTVVWDGKDDAGRYVEPAESCRVRVSLGLKAAFERNLFWSPHKRFANACMLLEATPEGMLVYEGRGYDQLKLFSHSGDYVRTIYPFPAGKLDKVLGLEMQVYPQDGQSLPRKFGCVQATMLTSGTSAVRAMKYKFGDGYAAMAMAAVNGRIALAYDSINRLSVDGTSGGLPLQGPKIGRRAKWAGYGGQGGGEEVIGPASAAFSPDGRTLYLTGFMWREFYMGGGDCLHGVLKVDFEKDGEPEIFAGTMKSDEGAGNQPGQFRVPAAVACDAQGRVYVADHMNDRVQIFSPDGKHLKDLKTPKPAQLQIDPRSGEIWVFSWPVIGISNAMLKSSNFEWDKLKPTLTRFASFDQPAPKPAEALPFGFSSQGFFLTGPMLDVAVDWWAPQPTLWVAGRKNNISRIDIAWGGTGAYATRDKDAWSGDQVRLLVEKDGKWDLKRDFGQDAKAAVVHVKPADFARQRLVFNPKSRMLYEIEDSGFSKSFYQMREINPETGAVKIVELPFDTEDLCVDQDGLAYLRTDTLLVRYDSETWREIPFDYGEEFEKVGFTTLGGSKRVNKVLSGVSTPGTRPVCWHQGGLWISPKGHLAISCCSREVNKDRKEDSDNPWARSRQGLAGKPYTPKLYPGRARWQEIHIFDKSGKLLREDALQGLHILNGVGIDAQDNLYVLAAANRHLGDKPYPNEYAGTVLKAKLGAAKVLSTSGGAQVPLHDADKPKRPPDLVNGKIHQSWVEGAEWFYGGVGYDGFNTGEYGGGCACWNSRFSIDYFARTLAPETDHHSVAILDTNGNLILRVGRYGNVDSAGPGSLVPLGGDEVGLLYACFVASDTDRRLFIADAGNGRIVSASMNYHVSETLQVNAEK